ncbi:isochorismatase family protein [Aquabacterium sp.]|uniref:isochorismatase family protein n=1 Tax=Aquabacterium sp. TaxID=1872578 RepID=UPI0024877D58|nr:isochorismatase family protein [Aquabacterium sp.]MDI1261535.1 isochorismatase family protein [Aquabacterium sp.]
MSIPKIATYCMPEPATWPTNRVNWHADPQRAALLIHDMQAYFLGFYDQTQAPVPDLVMRIQRLRQACHAAGIPVFYTAQPGEQPLTERALLQDWWGPGITADPEQSGIVHELTPSDNDTVLTKWRYSAFAKSDFQQQLQQLGRDQLIVCGIYAHIGVMTTCVDAFMRDIQPFLIADAVADFSLAEHEMALKWVAGRCGVVTGTDALIQGLAPTAEVHLYPSEQALLLDVAKVMEMPASDLQADDNLVDMGLDSIRLMAMIGHWKKAGSQVDFSALAKVPTIQAWWPLLTTAPSHLSPEENHLGT